jgi:sirohydrochlorin ferrochelatase
MRVVPVLLGLALCAVATTGEPLELSLRYSRLVALGWGAGPAGLQASVARVPRGGWGGVLDVGATSGVVTAMAGPRLTGRTRASATPFAQVLVGFAIGSHNTAFLAHPSVGLDLGSGRTTFRVQADWPILAGSEVFVQLARVSAGIAFR